jgi:hypothetical protein
MPLILILIILVLLFGGGGFYMGPGLGYYGGGGISLILVLVILFLLSAEDENACSEIPKPSNSHMIAGLESLELERLAGTPKPKSARRTFVLVTPCSSLA